MFESSLHRQHVCLIVVACLLACLDLHKARPDESRQDKTPEDNRSSHHHHHQRQQQPNKYRATTQDHNKTTTQDNKARETKQQHKTTARDNKTTSQDNKTTTQDTYQTEDTNTRHTQTRDEGNFAFSGALLSNSC